MTVTNNIYQKQIKYHVFNAVTNSELTELVPVFTTRPAFPTGCYNLTITNKNSGTFESASLFGQKY
jgi:hypothetical protein